MNIAVAILIILTLLCGALATALRADAVEMLRVRKIACKFGNPSAFQLVDGLAWELFRMDTGEFSARERRVFRLYFPASLAFLGLVMVTLVLVFAFGGFKT